MNGKIITTIKRAKDEILAKLDAGTSGTGDALAQLKSSLESELSPWTGSRAAKLDRLDTTVSSRADGSYYTPARASKLDQLDATVSSRLSKTDFDTWKSANGTVLDDLKKSSAEYRDRIAAVLGQMDAARLSTGDSIKLLTQYLEDIPIIGATSSTLTTQGGSYTIPRGYHNGSGRVMTDIANLRPENIKNGANVGGVLGTLKAKISFTDVADGYSNRKATCTIPYDALWWCWVVQKSGGSADRVYTYVVFPDGQLLSIKGQVDKWIESWATESISSDRRSFTSYSAHMCGIYMTWNT